MEGETCTHCGHNHDNIEKAEKGEIKKTVKTKTPYKVVEAYEKDFKRDFGKTVGAMANDLLKKLNSYAK